MYFGTKEYERQEICAYSNCGISCIVDFDVWYPLEMFLGQNYYLNIYRGNPTRTLMSIGPDRAPIFTRKFSRMTID